jgi:P-type conjugative transfer protein TrbJ
MTTFNKYLRAICLCTVFHAPLSMAEEPAGTETSGESSTAAQEALLREQIANQEKQLANQITIIDNQNKSLKVLENTLDPASYMTSLQAVTGLLKNADAMGTNLSELKDKFNTLYPDAATMETQNEEEKTSNAQARLTHLRDMNIKAISAQKAAIAALEAQQASVTASLEKSNQATSTLEASQVGNELLAENVKATQNLTAAIIAKQEHDLAKAAEEAAEKERLAIEAAQQNNEIVEAYKKAMADKKAVRQAVKESYTKTGNLTEGDKSTWKDAMAEGGQTRLATRLAEARRIAEETRSQQETDSGGTGDSGGTES